MTDQNRALSDIVAALGRRAQDEWDDGIWADRVVYWRNGSSLEMSIKGTERNERMRRELATLRLAIPEFQIDSTYHVDDTAGVIIELTTWSGTTREVPGSAVEGEFYHYTACYLYHVTEGRIVRIEVYDDAGTARQWNELMTHTRLLDVALS